VPAELHTTRRRTSALAVCSHGRAVGSIIQPKAELLYGRGCIRSRLGRTTEGLRCIASMSGAATYKFCIQEFGVFWRQKT
jgi:hypothetical protein